MHKWAFRSQSSCSMFKKLVSMLAAVAVFRNYVLGNIATRTCRSAPNGRMPNTPFWSDSITLLIHCDNNSAPQFIDFIMTITYLQWQFVSMNAVPLKSRLVACGQNILIIYVSSLNKLNSKYYIGTDSESTDRDHFIYTYKYLWNQYWKHLKFAHTNEKSSLQNA